MRKWFTSDQHFGHQNIIKYCNRPFSSVTEMNEEIIRRHNEVVKPEDYVFFLGDFSMSFKSVELYAKRLNGKKHLIPGNHDLVHPSHRKSKKSSAAAAEWLKKYVENGFDSVLSIAWRTPEDLLMSHMPYKDVPDNDHEDTGERFAQYRLEDKGGFLLHGHLHGRYRKKGRLIDVGVDAWNFTPVSLEQLQEIIATGPDTNLPPLPMTAPPSPSNHAIEEST